MSSPECDMQKLFRLKDKLLVDIRQRQRTIEALENQLIGVGASMEALDDDFILEVKETTP
jgi:hypothetical protein